MAERQPVISATHIAATAAYHAAPDSIAPIWPRISVDAIPCEAPDLISQAAIEELMKQANFEDPSGVSGETSGFDAAQFNLPGLQHVTRNAETSNLDFLGDVELNVRIELGRSRMLVEDVLKLAEGSVVELDKLAGDPVDVFVNDQLVARGEILVLDDNFCVRVSEIVACTKEEGM